MITFTRRMPLAPGADKSGMKIVKDYFGRECQLCEFAAYTEEEAKQKDLEYVYWRDAKHKPVGTWVRTDDNYVVQTIRDATAFLYTTLSLTSFRAKKPLLAEVRLRNRSFSTFSDKDRVTLDASSRRFQFVLKAVATANLEGRKPDWEKLGKVLKPHSKNPEASAKFMFKFPKVQDMLREETQKIFDGMGLTENTVAEAMKLAFEIAKEEKSAKYLLQFASDLADLRDMKPKMKGNFQLPPFDPMGSIPADTNMLKMIEEAKVAMASEGDQGSDITDITSGETYVDPAQYVEDLKK